MNGWNVNAYPYPLCVLFAILYFRVEKGGGKRRQEFFCGHGIVACVFVCRYFAYK
jgi:hypothetical protein